MIEIVKPNWEWIIPPTKDIPAILERCGRTCYKSECRITEDSAEKFVRMICRNHHESVLEHVSLTARLVCSRACSHQLVRHRIGAYSQESMRYCNYGKHGRLKVICPPSIGLPPGLYQQWGMGDYYVRQKAWVSLVSQCYDEYNSQLGEGAKPEDARFVLPNATKTEVVATYNLRMWRHVIRERALNPKAQWEIRYLFGDIADNLRWQLPCVFEDLFDDA